MKRLSKGLSLLLALQLAVVAWAFWPRSASDAGDASAPILNLDVAAVDSITLQDATNTLELKRVGSDWQIPDYHGLPVDQTRLDRLLQELPAKSRGWPVARTEGAQTRFEVATEEFQRHLQYSAGEQDLGDLYLGTSPGFRKVHTRVEGESDIFAIEFNSFDVPAEPAQWLDKSLLQSSDIKAIKGLDYQLDQSGENWVGNSQQSPDASVLESLLTGLRSLRVMEVTDDETATLLADTPAPPTLSVTTGKGEVDYHLYTIEDQHYVKRSDVPVYFTLSPLDHDRLNDANALSLFPPTETMEVSEAPADAH